ncbi:hypothetical protein H6P81_014930 [Aristolochia fimbriata]|uniref:C2 domain-containing protein n=1 Tax=Aristolochia fimbriata TaxID=158543 RepID=A0AAV7E624_ARIFI|nr:hypothetical protein H6P81_014930 [Aristolochia fimbriata]
MNSHQLFSSSLADSSTLVEHVGQKYESTPTKLATFTEAHPQQKVAVTENSEGFVGVLDVYIHQARDIHNICIYHKQDVYAKICLTSDPEITVSTQIINGGGKNPVFNESLQLKVRTVDSSLKCEIWMLSRVKNYLEDQLLGFSLVPLSEILVGNGKLMQEFSLSSTDLFHSPAGFVHLSLSYTGSSPEVLAIPAPQVSLAQDATLGGGSEVANSLPCEYTKIEFPDPNIANENHLMVSEYFGIPCTDLDSQSPESLITTENDNNVDSGVGVQVVESFSKDKESLKNDTPVSSISTNGSSGSPSTAAPTSTPSISDTQDRVSSKEEKSADAGETEINSSSGSPSSSFPQPIINIKFEPEQQVVQQDIVDMYMKSMQQFTESLAKMKLPMEIENGGSAPANGNSTTESKLQQKGTSSRVFYGSRAFF